MRIVLRIFQRSITRLADKRGELLPAGVPRQLGCFKRHLGLPGKGILVIVRVQGQGRWLSYDQM
jgi:hypothetical protein